MSTTIRTETLPLLTDVDTAAARILVRREATEAGMSPVDSTKMVTAASELARNAVIHGGGGSMTLEALQDDGRRGLRLTFEDQGPGIVDIERALEDGFTTGQGLGFGLGGARRLVHEFDLWSALGVGTRVTVLRWGS